MSCCSTKCVYKHIYTEVYNINRKFNLKFITQPVRYVLVAPFYIYTPPITVENKDTE